MKRISRNDVAKKGKRHQDPLHLSDAVGVDGVEGSRTF
jgi:hypothetical protein